MSIREIAHARVRYRYIKIYVLLSREGWDVGKYPVYRLTELLFSMLPCAETQWQLEPSPRSTCVASTTSAKHIDIFLALAQRREMNRSYREMVIQVFPEEAFLHILAKQRL